jgi:hypothetical protein
MRGDSKNTLDLSLVGGVTRVSPVSRDIVQSEDDVASALRYDQSHSCDAGLKQPPERVPLSWSEGVARLRAMEIPDCFSAARWRYIVDDAAAFLNQWGATAANRGWSIHDLFGVHPAAPTVRFDAMGLIPLLHGDPVVALTETTATIRKVSGSIQRFSRVHKVRGVCLWEIGR